MNFAEIQNAWRSPHNQPSPAQLETMKQRFIADHDRRRRGLKLFVTIVAGWLTVVTVRLLMFVFNPAPAEFAWSEEWGTPVMLVLPWVALGFLVQQLRTHDRDHGASAPTLAAGVQALLAENQMSRTRLKVVALLHAAMLAAVPLVVYQLRAVGKAGDEILVPAFVLWPLVSLVILLAMRWHYRTKLVPRQRELEAVLRSYE
jgi:hypothetical protein